MTEENQITETERINLAQSDLAKKIQENRSKYLVMNQVPEAVRLRFDALATEKYKGRYPAMLQELLLVYDGICSTGHEEIFMALEEFSAKLSYLQQQVNEMKDKTKPEQQGIWKNRRKKE